MKEIKNPRRVYPTKARIVSKDAKNAKHDGMPSDNSRDANKLRRYDAWVRQQI